MRGCRLCTSSSGTPGLGEHARFGASDCHYYIRAAVRPPTHSEFSFRVLLCCRTGTFHCTWQRDRGTLPASSCWARTATASYTQGTRHARVTLAEDFSVCRVSRSCWRDVRETCAALAQAGHTPLDVAANAAARDALWTALQVSMFAVFVCRSQFSFI